MSSCRFYTRRASPLYIISYTKNWTPVSGRTWRGVHLYNIIKLHEFVYVAHEWNKPKVKVILNKDKDWLVISKLVMKCIVSLPVWILECLSSWEGYPNILLHTVHCGALGLCIALWSLSDFLFGKMRLQTGHGNWPLNSTHLWISRLETH